MVDRQEEISKLQSFICGVDTELTMILQHLQWDRKYLLQAKPLVRCKYNENHKVYEATKDIHEQKCLLTRHGYSKEDFTLPDPLDTNANTLSKLNKSDIKKIIEEAAYADPSFKRGVSSTQETESGELEPLSLSRLQTTYTSDERRAIHDAVVAAAPFCHDLTDLALPSESGPGEAGGPRRSWLELLAELRDMKRRRARYRVPAKTTNYSDVLRDVISAQMEGCSGVKQDESNQPDRATLVTSPRGHEHDVKVRDKYHSSKYPRNSSYVGTNGPESKSSNHTKRKRDGYEDNYNEDRHSTNKRKVDNLIQYPDPRKYKEDRYNTDNNSTKRSRTYGYDENEDLKRKDYDGRKYDDRSNSNKSSVKLKQEYEIEQEDDRKTRYKEDRDRHSSKHRNRSDEVDYKRDRYDGVTKDKRERRHDDRYKESRKHEKSKEDKYRKDRHAGHSSSSRDKRYE